LKFDHGNKLKSYHTDISTDMKKKNRPNDVISIPHRSCFLEWLHLGVFVCARSVMGFFAIFNVFFILDNQQERLSYQTRQLR